MTLDEVLILDLLDMARYNEIDDLKGCLQSLIEQNVNLDQIKDKISGNTLFHMAAANGHLEILKLLLDYASKLSLNIKQYINTQNEGGNTALHWACMNGHAAIVNFLLSQGADPDTKNAYERTSLYYAYQCGKEEVKDSILNAIKVDEKTVEEDLSSEDQVNEMQTEEIER